MLKTNWAPGQNGHAAAHNDVARRLNSVVNASAYNTLALAIADAQGGSLLLPPGEYQGNDTARLDFSGVRHVAAHGAVLVNMHVILGDNIIWEGGRFDQSGGASANSIIRIIGSNVTVRDVYIRHTNRGYAGIEIKNLGGARPEFINIDGVTFFSGSKSCITAFDCAHVRISNCHVGSIAGDKTDDNFVFKDIGGNGVENVAITNCTFDGGSNMLGIGDPLSVGGYIRNVSLSNCSGINMNAIADIRPGSNESGGSGPCSDIVISNCTMTDLTGAMPSRVFDLTPGNECVLSNVLVENCTFRGRFVNSSPKAGIRIRPQAGSTVRDVVFRNIRFDDLYNGVANDGGHPGYPATHMVLVGSAGSLGLVERITFDGIEINGCSGSAFAFTTTNNAEPIRIIRPKVRNAVTGASVNDGLLRVAACNVTLVDPVYDSSITPTKLVKRETGANESVRLDAAGPGSPEAAVAAAVGSLWRRTDGGAATSLYVKESGAGNTGWIGK